jgi:hypothetical protein
VQNEKRWLARRPERWYASDMKKRAPVVLFALLMISSCATTPQPSPTAATQAAADNASSAATTQDTRTTQAANDASANVETFSTFATYGMKLVSCSPKQGVDEASIVLSSTTPLKVIADMKIAGATDSQTVDVTKDGANWNVSALFPATGVYQVRVFAKPESDTGNSYYGTVYVTFTAAVAGDQKIYTTGTSMGSQKIRLADVKKVAEKWEPYPGISFDDYMTALLAKDVDVPFQGHTFRLTKGTPIRFEAYGTSLGSFAAAPDLDVSVTINGGSDQLAAGGMMYVGGSTVSGTLKADMTVTAGAISFDCPGGSVVVVTDGKLAAVRMSKDSTLSFKDSSFVCKGDATFSDWGSGQIVNFTLARPAAVALGPTLAMCPAGTDIQVVKDRVTYIVFNADSTIHLKGKPMSVKSGWTVVLDDMGNVRDSSLMTDDY